MSRTLKTKPYYALLVERGAARQYHDHSEGSCDLIPLEEWIERYQSHEQWDEKKPETHCGWELTEHFQHEHPRVGVQQVGDDTFRSENHKKERQTKKADILRSMQEDTE